MRTSLRLLLASALLLFAAEQPIAVHAQQVPAPPSLPTQPQSVPVPAIPPFPPATSQSPVPPVPASLPDPEVAAAMVMPACPAGIDSRATRPLNVVPPGTPSKCKAIAKNGFLVADPACTPGAINPTLTLAVLQDPNFRTGCVRDNLTTEEQKNITYSWYGIPKPRNNTGESQVCELDHLVSLYLGGADSLDNIWPQCGPDAVTLNNRYFKQKDHVEVYLGNLVRAGKISLADAQHGIATDWTQYIKTAAKACPQTGCAGPAAAPID